MDVVAKIFIEYPSRLLLKGPPLSPTVEYKKLSESRPPMAPQETNDYIRHLLSVEGATMIGRFGSTELRAVIRTLLRDRRTAMEKAYALVARLEHPSWSSRQYENLQTQSGFFPISPDHIERFVSLMLESAGEVDLLGSWVPGENILGDLLEGAQVTTLEHLEPFFVENPWTATLEGKRVLVIHPFSDSITRQFERNRERLFPHKNTLPEFELDTLRAVQSLSNEGVPFSDWFEALDYMTVDALSREFDVAVVGCGAYGFPLSARLKKAGKKVVHLGGVTQVLFGLKGKRWDERSAYKSLYNDSWTRPTQEETPAGARRVDRGVYW